LRELPLPYDQPRLLLLQNQKNKSLRKKPQHQKLLQLNQPNLVVVVAMLLQLTQVLLENHKVVVASLQNLLRKGQEERQTSRQLPRP
jgi:hypothetical protein